MKVIGVIPARWASTRFPGKVLADINGKPMIQYVWEAGKKAKLLADVLIACDDKKVEEAARNFGAKTVMTSPDHPSGTDRISEAVRDIKADIVVNIQGDEPLIKAAVIDALAKALRDDKNCQMATVVRRLTDEKDLHNPNVVKAVLDADKNALYFSRSAIPYNREQKAFVEIKYYKHLGLYAYRKKFLLNFKKLPVSRLEQAEKLEQLRVLEAGIKIKTVETTYDTVGVDMPEDLIRVQELLREKKNG